MSDGASGGPKGVLPTPLDDLHESIDHRLAGQARMRLGRTTPARPMQPRRIGLTRPPSVASMADAAEVRLVGVVTVADVIDFAGLAGADAREAEPAGEGVALEDASADCRPVRWQGRAAPRAAVVPAHPAHAFAPGGGATGTSTRRPVQSACRSHRIGGRGLSE